MNSTTIDTPVQVRSVSWVNGQRSETTHHIAAAEFADLLQRGEETHLEWLEDHSWAPLEPSSGIIHPSPNTDLEVVENRPIALAKPSRSRLSTYPKWNIRSPDGLGERVQELGAHEYLIENILPVRSVGILVGDSGLGKSPLAYQMAISIAAGVPFLGYGVKQTYALYLDFENGLSQVEEMVKRIARFHGVLTKDLDGTLGLWNVNDARPTWGQNGYDVLNLIRELRPPDSMYSLAWVPNFPEIVANAPIVALRPHESSV